ncbi:MAG: V-type ATPase 116kDa subunit family protein [Candidatus Odinarchaeota archaeon]
MISFETERMQIIKLSFFHTNRDKVLKILAERGNVEIIDVEKKGQTQLSGQDQQIMRHYSYFQQLNSSLGVIPALAETIQGKDFKPAMTALDDTDSVIKATEEFLQKNEAVINDTRAQLQALDGEIGETKKMMEFVFRIKPLEVDPLLIGDGDHFYVTAGQIKTEKLKELEWRLKEITGDNFLFLVKSHEAEKYVEPEIFSKEKSLIGKILAPVASGTKAILSAASVIVKVPLQLVGRFFSSVYNLVARRTEKLAERHEKLAPNSLLVVGVLKKHKETLVRLLATTGFIEFSMPAGLTGSADEILERLEKQYEELLLKKNRIQAEFDGFITENGAKMLALEEQLRIARERIEAAALVRQEENMCYLTGWVTAKEAQETVDAIKKVDDSIISSIEDTDLPADQIPSKMNNNKFAKPYEIIVSSFGSPGYNELDPTKVFFIVFPILFALMFADVLHGFFVFLLGFLGSRSKEPLVPPSGIIQEFAVYFRTGNKVFMHCGLMSIFFGFMFGSFGGLHGPENPFFKPWWFLALSREKLAHEGYRVYDFAGEVLNFDGQFALLEVAILVGVLFLSLGLILNFINNWRHGHKEHALTLPGAFLVFYLSMIGQLFSYGLNLTDWFNSDLPAKPIDLANVPYIRLISIPNPRIDIVGTSLSLTLLLLLVSAVFLIFYHLIWIFITDRGKVLDHVSEWLEYTISLISNTISFSRIFAINIVHGILSGVFNSYLGLGLYVSIPAFVSGYNYEELAHESGSVITMANGSPLIGLPVLGLLLGGAAVTALEMMVSLIQSIRLSWVEFFTKMAYQGSGRMFKPFKTSYAFTNPPAVSLS